MILFQCAQCEKPLKVKDDVAGKRVKCPHCGQVVLAAQLAASPVPGGASQRDGVGPEVSTLPSAPEGKPFQTNPSEQTLDLPKREIDVQTRSPEEVTPVPGNEQHTQHFGADKPETLSEAEEFTEFLAPAQQPDEIGRLGPYRVLKVLGAGGMGVVFKAEDPHLERLVAIKAMLPCLAASKSAKKRFLREAKTAAGIKHPHVVTIHAVGEDRGAPYLAMEFLEGESLDERLKKGTKMPMAEVLLIGRQIAEGLAAAHDKGLIHRDIKPGNIWLESTETVSRDAPAERVGPPRSAIASRLTASPHVKILDFGLARAESDEAHITQSGTIVGTPAFMAPEQASGEKVDQRCDLFSLGCVLYRMATGEAPFKGANTITILSAIAREQPKLPSLLNEEVPPQLSDLIMRLLAKDAADRPKTAHEVAEAFRAIEGELAASTVTLARKDSTIQTEAKQQEWKQISAPPSGRRWLWAVGGAGLFALFAMGIILLWPTPHGLVRIESDDPNVVVKGKIQVTADGKVLGEGELPAVRDVAEKKTPPIGDQKRPDLPPAPTPPLAMAPFDAKQARAHQETWVRYLQMNVESTNTAGMKMVVIPPGEFLMGATPAEIDQVMPLLPNRPQLSQDFLRSEGPQHAVVLTRPFLMSVYPVTLDVYRKVMGPKAGTAGKGVDPKDAGQYAATNLKWLDAAEFCNRLSDNEGLRPCYQIKDGKATLLDTDGYRVPTEAEWEFACRAGTTTFYFHGNDPAATVEYRTYLKWDPVGIKKANPFGLFDIVGMAGTWCQDFYDAKYYESFGGKPAIDPRGPAEGKERSLRGGYWGDYPDALRSARRWSRPGEVPADFLALRVVRTVKAPNPPAYVPVNWEEKEAKRLQQVWATKLKAPVEEKSKSGIVMVLIPPGGGALPKPYWLGKYEVTQGEWESVMRYNPSSFVPTNPDAKSKDTNKFPVENVSWFDSMEFCNMLSEREGMKPYYQLTVTKRGGKDDKQIEEAEVKILGGSGYHIPTDVQWEHGGRAGTTTNYHFGDKDEELPEYAWFDKNSDGRTHAVGEKKPNAFGLHDVHGNVREWNEEMLTSKSTGAPERALRGGYWYAPASYCAVSASYQLGPAHRSYALGLRVARSLGDVAHKIISNEIGMSFSFVPGGKAWLGGGAGKPGDKEVDISEDFWMGTYEVTQEEWEKVMGKGKNPSHFSRNGAGKDALTNVSDAELRHFPVENISWNDCQEFVKRLNKMMRDKGEPAGWEYRLPTSEQWEYACRGGPMTDRTESTFDFYLEKPALALAKEQASFADSDPKRPRKVGTYSPNKLGLFDMHGNVAEWCEDGLDKGPGRVLRGGGWYTIAAGCRAGNRNNVPPSSVDNYLGLRLVRVRVAAR